MVSSCSTQTYQTTVVRSKEDITELSAEVRSSREDRRSFDARVSKLEEAVSSIKDQLKDVKLEVFGREK